MLPLLALDFSLWGIEMHPMFVQVTSLQKKNCLLPALQMSNISADASAECFLWNGVRRKATWWTRWHVKLHKKNLQCGQMIQSQLSHNFLNSYVLKTLLWQLPRNIHNGWPAVPWLILNTSVFHFKVTFPTLQCHTKGRDPYKWQTCIINVPCCFAL